MAKWWPLVLVIFLFGCGARQQMVTSPVPPQPPVVGKEIVVEAEGVAYMGDKDTLAEVRRRAREDAFQKLLEKGARIYLETYRERKFGMLTEDRVRQVMAGVMREVETLHEGLEGNVYRVRLKARVVPTDITRLLGQRKEESSPKKKESLVTQKIQVPPQGPTSSQVCFHQFTEIYLARAFPVLIRAPGVKRVKRLPNTKAGIVCYRLYGDESISLEEIENYLRRTFRFTKVQSFKINANPEAHTLDLYFDAGFE